MAHPGLAFGVQVNSASCWRVAQGIVQGHMSVLPRAWLGLGGGGTSVGALAEP